MDPPLSIIGENGKEGMKSSTEKENNPRFLVHGKRLLSIEVLCSSETELKPC